MAVDEPIGSVGVAGFGRVEPLGCAPPSIGGVEGMLDALGAGGFTAPLIVLASGAVAEVSADMPVGAVGELAHQSLLARALGEAFI